MIKRHHIRKIKFFIKDYWQALLTLAVLAVILLLISVSYKTFKVSGDNLVILKEEVNLLKNRSDTLNFNKSLTQDQITVYNKILTSLIPETEDYFSIIYALEAISQKTGFNIVAYTINLSKSSKEKLSLNIEGKGDLEAFKRFLNEYEFSGGRMVTSEKIEFSGANFTNTKVSLNFYSKKFTFNETVVPQLTKGDVAKLDSIKQKIHVAFTDNSTSSTQDYQVKTDPF